MRSYNECRGRSSLSEYSVTRRRLFTAIFGSIFLSCGQRRPGEQITLPDSLAKGTRQYIEKHGLPSIGGTSTDLIDFLVQAEQNRALDRTAPLAFLSDKFGIAQVTKVDERRQIMVLQEQLLTLVKVRADLTTLVVVSSAMSISRSNSSVNAVLNAIEMYLPQVDEILPGLFTGRWLHIDLLTTGRTSYTVGNNLLLSSGDEQSHSVIVHELVHTYNSHLARQMPVFITEGVPEVIAFILTGHSTLSQFVNGEDVHLSFTTPDVSSEAYLEESANGFLLFYALLNIVGVEKLSQMFSSILRDELTDGRAILRSIASMAIDAQKVERLFEVMIADYVS